MRHIRRAGGLPAIIVSTSAVLLCDIAVAHSVKQKAGTYTDTQGRERQSLQMDLGYEGKPRGTVSASSLNVTAGHNNYVLNDEAYSDYYKQIYGSPTYRQNTLSVAGNLTWDRLTDTRVLASMQTDGKISSRSFGGGASQWYRHETIRVSYDISRTIVEQPEFRQLDYDSQEIGNPTLLTSTGATVALRHLATDTTIMDYSAAYISNDNRPATITGTVAFREFFPTLDGALHGTATRAYNRGYIGLDTTYGQVDAWFVEAAWLKNLWKGASGRAAYRYYKEDETTRAYEDETVFGSDMYAVSLVQEITKKMVDGISVPLQVEAGAAKYLTNIGIAANSYEMGVSARF